MATATITPDQNAVIAEIFIAAPPARVFQAISDPAQIPRWWGQDGLYHVTKSTMDVRPGGKWRSDGRGADGTDFYVEGEYLEVDPPRLLVHTWIGSYDRARGHDRPLGTRAADSERSASERPQEIRHGNAGASYGRKASPEISSPPRATATAGSACSAGWRRFVEREMAGSK